jgi:hypothetical protein
MLIDDYTSIPSWQACRDRYRHIVPASILVKTPVSWAYRDALESYPRSYESVIDIQPRSNLLYFAFVKLQLYTVSELNIPSRTSKIVKKIVNIAL